MTLNQEESKLIKIIVCDLDGTLLNHNKDISPATVEYLIQLQKAGYLLILASGRFFYELEPYIHQLHMKKYHGFAVCANGLEVHHLETDTIDRFDSLTEKEIKEILTVSNQKHINAYANDKRMYQAFCNLWLFYSIQLAQMLLRPFKHIKYDPIQVLFHTKFLKRSTPYHFQQLDKICFLSSHRKLKSFQREILNDFPNQYKFYYINRFAMEIVKQNVGKKDALSYICEQQHLTLQNVLAFGDSGNDEELLQSAGIGITMKNGFYQTKRKARILSYKTNEQEGVLDMLKRLSLIG